MSTQENANHINIKPNKNSYVIFNSSIIIISSILSFALVIAWLTIDSIYFSYILIPIFLAFIWYIFAIIKYKKEKYEITNKKIIYHYWSIFSDSSVEINLDKIVLVKASLPFLQNKIFDTGDLIIKTAWSSTWRVKLSNIENTLWIYEEIQEKMKNCWFQLKKDKLVQEARPHILWVIWEVFSKALWLTFIFFYMWAAILWDEEANIDPEQFIIPLMMIGILYLITITIYSILSYLDLKNRKYDVFSDSIFYTEGFLSKHYAFIPMESVSDTENTQSFLSKIFGLHDVIVSSEWASNRVLFKNMVDGDKMMKNIRYLKEHTIMHKRDTEEETKSEKAESLVWFKNKLEESLDYDKEFTADFSMNPQKTLIPIFILLIPPFTPLFFVALFAQIINVNFTKYKIKKSSIEMTFEFFNKRQNTFSVEKITNVEFIESLIDKMFGTCSIKFYSIGSNMPIVFRNIKKTKNLQSDVLRKIGINNWWKDELVKKVDVNFNTADYFKATLGITLVVWSIICVFIAAFLFFAIFDFPIEEEYYVNYLILAIFAIVMFPIALIYLTKFIYNKYYFSEKRYIQNIYNNYIKSKSWIIFVSSRYALLRHIKWLKSRKYPLSKNWDFYLNIAWEQMVQQRNRRKANLVTLLSDWAQAGGIISSNSIKMSYVTDTFKTHEEVDTILNSKELDNEVLNTSKEDVWNSILSTIISLWFVLLLASMLIISWEPNVIYILVIIIPVIILFWIFVLWWIIWSIKVKNYDFEKDRLVFASWIIYKRKHSILYKRFNFIDKQQWFVNKIFKNGSVWVYTLWSWSKELSIKNISNFRDIYELLKVDNE